jgi:LCP family protein required for cell wall assembly
LRIHAQPTKQTFMPAWLATALIASIVLSGIFVSIFAYFSVTAFLRRPFNPVANAAEDVAGVAPPPLGQDGPVSLATVPPNEPTPTAAPTQEPWTGTDRLTVLVMGIDRRPGESFVSRTDSMMLVSYDPLSNKASILSIPRDLYVVIPDWGRDRINTAFVRGARGNNPAGGAELAMQTVEFNLGVPVDHYILVDFNAVVETVDELGGIDVEVPFEIYDATYPDMNYGYDPLYIPAGWQHLDGELALKYARTRHVDNDFGRANRQQQVMLAVRDEALELGFAQLLRKAPVFWQQTQEGFRTDLSLEQLLQLAKSASTIPDDNILRGVLDYDYVIDYRTEGGASVLILINERAEPLIQELFYHEEIE